ncbi:putative linoleate 9S-lipoxygenase 5 [Senna tora]|uniref:Lipoxygenase n=1 Tax=Senna tora TaxID=362788 RepID=A0A834XHW2_9FABA|nr:putative linoleate 9S-lipoxygenase 5 [Senna tora]
MAGVYKIKGTLVMMNPNLKGLLPSASLDLFQFFTIKLINASSNPIPAENGFRKVEYDEECGNNSLDGSNMALKEEKRLGEPMCKYVVHFDWSNEMGIPEAFVIRNLHPNDEFFLESLTIEGIPNLSSIHFVCKSWVYPDSKYETSRVFFINKSRLPDDQGFDQYVPRDERFDDIKLLEFVSNFPKSLISNLKSFVKAELVSKQEEEFESFEQVYDILYEDGFTFPVPQPVLDAFAAKFPIQIIWKDGRVMKNLHEKCLRVSTLLQSPSSNLNPEQYGDQTSKITKEQLQRNLDGITVDEALRSKKLFILDHHDSFMQYLRKINTETSRRAYASRTILFLQNNGTLKPLAIELSLPHPQGDQFGAISKVFLPSTQGVDASLWFLAKAFVLVNDAGHHQLVSHWLNTHAVIEPFVIATHRHLSVLHPIHKLLHPHFRDTMFINAIGRQNLANAEGIIETTMLPQQFCMEMSSKIYKDWNFIDQALPNDLLKRGMAIRDPNAPHGLNLVIKDYPYAVDGLDIWAAINTWVQDYVSCYYKTDDDIKQDTELRSWWKEVVEVGHGDLKDKPWWPKMQTREELIESCTIIIWTSSALHAAVNFGQYPYAGYILNRPTLSRRLMPEEGSEEYEELVRDPNLTFLKTITPKYETFLDLSIIETLSSHPSSEIYLGTRDNPYWTSDLRALEAFKRFGRKLGDIEQMLIRRNKDATLLNRVGPVKIPYTLLYPTSQPGLTGRGIPNSVSI